MKEEDITRIEEAAKKYASLLPHVSELHTEAATLDFKAGADYERPISYNQGWNDAIQHIKKEIQLGWYNAPAGYVAEEIQKLKKP